METTLLFSLLRCLLSEEAAQAVQVDSLPQAVYTLAERHDLAHLLGEALRCAGIHPQKELGQQLTRRQMIAVSRYEQLTYELTAVCAALEQAQIPHLPLKGAVLRQYYPQPWMRSSCDVDILVHPEDLELAVRVLTESLSYRKDKAGAHDVSLFSPGGIHIELHYALVEKQQANAAHTILDRVWELAHSVEDSYLYEMDDPVFYFYHIAHMAKHVEQGGCGIRSFLDLWILEHRVPHDDRARHALLQQGGLLPFADACRRLAKVWFSAASPDDLTRTLESYILTGGTFGNRENLVTVQQHKQGGRGSYLFSRIFMPLQQLQHDYPILKKHPWLAPAYQVYRWLRLLRPHRLRRSLVEWRTSRRVSSHQVDKTAELFRQLGL